MEARGLRLGAILVVLVGCDSLPAMQTGVCGNKVVDGNEDCDTFAVGSGTVCRPPGSPGECRYACGVQADGTKAVCPTGMGCGTDGTCRSPNGAFVAKTQPTTGSFADLLVADVDGDGRADVVGVEPSDFSTSFFDGTLAMVTSVRTARNTVSPVHPLLGDVTGDGLADLLAGASGGTLLNLGSSTRSFIPTACPSIALPGVTDAKMIVLKGLPANPGQTVFVMATYLKTSGIALLDKGGNGTIFTLLTQSPSAVSDPIAVGHMIENPTLSPCDDIAFGYVGGAEVDVYTACAPNGMGVVTWNQYLGLSGQPVPIKVSLPTGATLVRGPLLLDVNGDKHLDFLIDASRCSGCDEVDVAYGVGDGTFNSNPNVPAGPGDNSFSVYPLVTGALPLAMGDINGDGVPDQVSETQVLVSNVQGPTVTFVPMAEGYGATWTEAVIADFNHDGIPDVAAGTSQAPNIDFFLGVGGGTFNPFVIQTSPVRHFTVADYDGDLVNDLAVAEIASAKDTLGDSVSILFGNPVGAPNAPVSMGRFVSVRQMAAAKAVDLHNVLSGDDGLITASTPNPTDTYFGAFGSSGDRVLRSPLVMTTGVGGTALSTGLPTRYAYGHFTTATGPIQLAAVDAQTFPVTTAPVHYAWLIGTDGSGRFDSAQLGASTSLPESAAVWSDVAIVGVDLDGSGLDQLVALGPSPDATPHGVALIAHAQPGPNAGGPMDFVFGAPTQLAGLVDRTETNATSGQTGRAVASDIDGDGKPDVIAVATVSGATSVVVFWNDHTGQLGTMTAIPNPNNHAVTDFALVDAGGGGPSVAILTDEGVSLVSFTQRAPNPSKLAIPVTSGHLIAAGDVDGDGVADLVVATDTSFVVYRGQPVRP